MSSLRSTDTQSWTPRILAGLAEGSQLRVPLSVFYFTSLRRDLETELAERGQTPMWDEATASFDDAGHPLRVVPLVAIQVKPAPVSSMTAADSGSSVDDLWCLEADGS
jgi:hypothetical protein